MTSSPQIKDLPSHPDLHPPRQGHGSQPPSLVTHAAGTAVGWAERHQRWLAFGFVVLVVATLGAWGLHLLAQRQAAQDSQALAQAFGLLEAPIKPASDAVAHNDAGAKDAADAQEQLLRQAGSTPEFATKQARDEAALAAFSQVATRLGPKTVGPLASMMASHLEAELGLLGEAQTRLTALRAQLPPASSLFALVVLRLAAVTEQRGDAEGALAALEPLVAEHNLYLADEAGLMRARLLAARGEVAAARAALEQVRSRSPGSPLLDDVRIALSELPSAPEAPSSSAADRAPPSDGTRP